MPSHLPSSRPITDTHQQGSHGLVSGTPTDYLVDWPTKGCDCNPIENLWGFMKQEWGVDEKTREAVSRKAGEVWEGIRRTPDLCSRLVDSVPTRLQLVIEANGGWIRY